MLADPRASVPPQFAASAAPEAEARRAHRQEMVSGLPTVFPNRETFRWNEAFVEEFLGTLSSTNSWQWTGGKPTPCSSNNHCLEPPGA